MNKPVNRVIGFLGNAIESNRSLIENARRKSQQAKASYRASQGIKNRNRILDKDIAEIKNVKQMEENIIQMEKNKRTEEALKNPTNLRPPSLSNIDETIKSLRPKIPGSGGYTSRPQSEINKNTLTRQGLEKLEKEERLKNRKDKYRRAKVGAGLGVAGLYIASDASSRYQNGGNLTTNSEGKRDMIGIPFL